MRIVLQRVSSASVTIAGRVTGRIDRGLLILVSVEDADTAADGEWLAQKIAKLRIFADAEGQMNLSLLDLAAAEACSPSAVLCPLALVVSQFTLHASTQKGTRPSFNRAARPEIARPLYEQFVTQLRAALSQPPAQPVRHSLGDGGSAALGRPIATGEFGAMMQVALVNDGPVTLIIDSKIRE